MYPQEVVSDCFGIACFLLSPSPFSPIYSIFFKFYLIFWVFLGFFVCLFCFFFLSSSPIPVRVVSEWLCGAYLLTGVNPQQPYLAGLSYLSPEDSGIIILILMHPNILICTLKKINVCRCEYTDLCVLQWKKENNSWSGAQLRSLLAVLFCS